VFDWKDPKAVKAYRHQYYLQHREENYQRNRDYQKAHRKEINERNRLRRQQIKKEVLIHYGKGVLACIHCGFADIRALSIDHINGGGTKHYREIGNAHLSEWLRKQGFPEGYQTLCMNCQWIKRAIRKEHKGIKYV